MKNSSTDLFAFATNKKFWLVVMKIDSSPVHDRQLDDFILWLFAGDAIRKRLNAIYGKNGTTVMAANAILTSAHSIQMGDEDAAETVGRWISESIIGGDAGIFRELAKIVGGNKKSGKFGLLGDCDITASDPEPCGETLAAVMFDELVSIVMDGPLPTKAELDKATLEAYGHRGTPEPKDLREARNQLGLNGLPEGSAGRPKGGGGF